MNSTDYEYYGMLASTWDLFRGDSSNWEDKLFFREVIRKYGQPVLDVGCGTGRLILDYLEEGLDVDGVDNSPEMLALCRQKAEKRGLHSALFQQEMEELDLPRRYATILVPSSSFQLLPGQALAEEAIRRLYHHLAPGGVLVMTFMIDWKEGMPLQFDWVKVAEIVRPEDGALIRRWMRERYDPANRITALSEERYEVVVDDAVVFREDHERANAFRWYNQDQATAMYASAGFQTIQVLSGFSFQPAQETDDLFCLLGQK
jgi:ubiquinone/menaquinone biosynthesis C-methylase UbiE